MTNKQLDEISDRLLNECEKGKVREINRAEARATAYRRGVTDTIRALKEAMQAEDGKPEGIPSELQM